MTRSSRLVEVSVRMYRTLLRAYPAAFRRRYGMEMTQVFRDMAKAAARRRGALGLIALWFRVVPDLVLTVAVEQWGETERRIAMWREFWGPAHFRAAFVLAVILAALMTPADPASMLIAVIPIFGVYLAVLAAKGLGSCGRSLAILLGILHAVWWTGLLRVPTRLVNPKALIADPEALLSVARVHVSSPFVALVVGMLLATLTTALFVGAVALMSRGGRKADGAGPDEDAEIAT
ncbi:MAG: hypothetical protein A2V98_17410 [Planctomycetes bacterium RBG_16_64_12]|nr:MAG: hypothetical protein A2V98_17410 [Planctomycetes bacterium RBG_16_64_12]